MVFAWFLWAQTYTLIKISTERKRRKVKLRGKSHTRCPWRLAAACISTQLSLGPLNSSSRCNARLCCPRPNSNNHPSAQHPSPCPPCLHSTPVVSLLPVSPTIRIHGPTLHPPPPTPPLLLPEPQFEVSTHPSCHPTSSHVCSIQSRRDSSNKSLAR